MIDNELCVIVCCFAFFICIAQATRRERRMTRILAIDSDRLVCSALERALKASGYSVTIATSGHAGLEAAREPFAAAIVDLCLPDMSGVDAIRALRAIAPGARVIVMSELMTAWLGIGAPDFLGMVPDLRGTSGSASRSGRTNCFTSWASAALPSAWSRPGRPCKQAP